MDTPQQEHTPASNGRWRSIGPPREAITFTLEHITPEMAAAWLKTMPSNNRRPVEGRVRQYAGTMLNDGWIAESPALIAFNTRGECFDGQHRLMAIVRTGLTIPMYVMRGCDPKAFATCGDVAARSAGQVVNMGGGKYGGKSVAMMRLMLMTRDNVTNVTMSTAELAAQVRLHRKTLTWALELIGSKWRASVLAAAAYAWPTTPGAAGEFLLQISGRADVPTGSPSRLVMQLTSAKRHSIQDRVDLMAKSLNAIYLINKERPVSQLRVSPTVTEFYSRHWRA